MKSIRILVLAVCMLIGSLSAAQAVSLYVDSAPDAYNSPDDYDEWWDNAKLTLFNNAFINMRNSVNPTNTGTKNFEIQDAVLYDFDDYGRRLHFVYWLPGATVASLAGNFEISIEYVWDGETSDYFDENDEYDSQIWLEPTKWEVYNGGVIGSAGFSLWGAYGVDTPSALAADIAEWEKSLGNVTIHTSLDGEISSLTAYHQPVPEPSTIILLAAGLGGLAIWRKKRKV